MGPVPIEAAEPGDIPDGKRYRLDGQRLLLRRDEVQALAGQRIRTAEEFLVRLQSFPSSIVALVPWDHAEIASAAQSLVAELEALTGRNYTRDRAPMPMGAIDPRSLA